MQKIKLPLRVCDKKQTVMPFWIMDANGEPVGTFTDQQIAQLFADCFEAFYEFNSLFDMGDDEYSTFKAGVAKIQKRAAEAVKE